MLERLKAALRPARAERSRRSPMRRAAFPVVLSLVLVPALALGVVAPAQAAPIRSFAPVFSVNTNGQILMAANTLLTCSTATGATGRSSCLTARDATSGNYSNNNYTSEFVDVDGDAGTFNSSSASLTIPSGGNVLFAALVWGARTGATSTTNADRALRGTARLTVPGGTAQTVTAQQLDASSDNAYQAYADVTSLVAAAGTGSYTLANVQALTGAINQHAGWSLVVAVSDPIAPARNLTIFTGLASVADGDPLPTFTVSGFLTPPSGPVKTTLGAVTYEGDMGLTGDTFKLNSTTIADALNPADNPFNSTISNRGTQVSTRNPAYANQLGFDADLFAADGILPNSATSATLSLTTGGEQYFPGVVTFATELYDPKLLGTKTVTDLDGAPARPGDRLRYEIPVENVGLDTASDSRFFDAIPTGTTYVPGSLTIDGVAQTDAADSVDNGQYVGDANGHVLAYLGAGATPTSGGQIPMTSGTAQHRITFDVIISAADTNGQELTNAAALTSRGRTTRAASSSATNAVISPVVTAPIAGNNPPDATAHILSFTPAPAARSLVIDVLAGDTDPEGDPLTVVAVTDAAGGSVRVNPDGTVTYAPRDDFAGRDVFTYTIQDPAGNLSTASVQVEVLNTVPVAGDDAVGASAGRSTTLDLVANDTDANGDTLAVRAADATTARGGSVTVTGGAATYTPPAGFRGTDTFTYVVEDSRGGSDTATVTVTVTNDVPVAGDDTYATGEGTAVAVSVLANDTDVNGDTLTATLATAPAHGTLTLNPDGTGTYTPTAGFHGTDSFTYTVSDGAGGTDEGTVTLTVNGTPVAVDDTASTAGATAVDVAVLDNDTDPDGDTLTVASLTQPAHGSVVTAVSLAGTWLRYTPDARWAGPDSFTYTVTDGRGLTDTASVVVTVANAAPVANLDTVATATSTPATNVDVLGNDTDANIPGTTQQLTVTGATADNGATVVVNPGGTLTVTPAAGFAGTVTVTYTVSDGAGGTDEGTLAVTVDNAAPTAGADGPVTTSTGTSVLVDVLRNDTDPNGDTLTLVPGSLTAPLDGLGLPRGSVVLEAGQVRYAPPPGFAGTVTFTYDVSDGSGGRVTGTVTVVVADAAPVANPDAVSTATNTPAVVDVLANDTDPNIPGTTQQLTVTGATADNGATVVLNPDGTLTVTPATGFRGAVTVTYTVSDGAGGTDDGTATVTVENAAPSAVADTATTAYGTAVSVDVLRNDTDANTGDVLTVVPTGFSPPVDADGRARGTVTVRDGAVTYTPTAGFSGVVTFRYTVTDGTSQSEGTVTVTVANAAPTTARDSAATTPGRPVTIDVLAGDTDADGGTLALVGVTQPGHGTVTVVDGKLLYTPDATFTGTVTFTYTVSDGQGGLSVGEVSVEVSAAATTPAPTAATPAAALARTGAQVAGAAALALVLLVGGLALTLTARRRRL